MDICPLKVNAILLHLVVMKNSNTIRTDTTEQTQTLNFRLTQRKYTTMEN
jgi:hypothetical protein